jgi:hypothetical protein
MLTQKIQIDFKLEITLGVKEKIFLSMITKLCLTVKNR